jgi:ABC-2 type transport system ATP-binding protein
MAGRKGAAVSDARTDNKPVIAVEGLHKVFRDFWRRPKVRAVAGIDLAVGPGEVFGLLGPNGSGKSTTIKLLLGLLHPTAGSIRVLSRPPDDVRSKAAVGYLPEESYLYPNLTARETLAFYARLFDLPAAARRDRIDELLEMIGLAHAGDRLVGEFSKGMARRVALAQALVNDPRLLILDEPTSGLDPLACRQMKDLIIALARRGKTVLLSSHLLADVQDVCDRIAILYSGRIHAEGRVDQLLARRDALNLTVPALSQEDLEKAVALLRREIGADPSVAHPKMSLEQFFLDVVGKAHSASGAPSGAGRSPGVASFLTEGPRED